MELLPHVHLIESRASNIYLYADEEALLLVDAGMPRQASLVLDYIRKIGRHPSELKHILLTHADLDHAGSLAEIWRQTGATIYTGRQTADLVANGRSANHMPRLAQFLIDRFLHYQSVPLEAMQTVADSDTLPVMGGTLVLATPGHTLGHHAFFVPAQGLLFAGDALNTRGGRLQNSDRQVTADHEAARQSALRLLRLTPALFACGHGQPMKDHSAGDLMRLQAELQAGAK